MVEETKQEIRDYHTQKAERENISAEVIND